MDDDQIEFCKIKESTRHPYKSLKKKKNCPNWLSYTQELLKNAANNLGNVFQDGGFVA